MLMAAQPIKPSCRYLWLPRFAVAGPATAMTAGGGGGGGGDAALLQGTRHSHVVFWLFSTHDITELLDLQIGDSAAPRGRWHPHQQQQGALPGSC